MKSMKQNSIRILLWIGLLAGCGTAPPPSVQVSRPDSAPTAIVIQKVSVFDTESLQTGAATVEMKYMRTRSSEEIRGSSTIRDRWRSHEDQR